MVNFYTFYYDSDSVASENQPDKHSRQVLFYLVAKYGQLCQWIIAIFFLLILNPVKQFEALFDYFYLAPLVFEWKRMSFVYVGSPVDTTVHSQGSQHQTT